MRNVFLPRKWWPGNEAAGTRKPAGTACGWPRYIRTAHRLFRSIPCALMVFVVWGAVGLAAEEPTERALYVPFDDLPLILGGQNERMFMTREEYQQLVTEARKKPPTKAPVAALIDEAQYDATIENGIAVIHGRLVVEALDPGLHVIPLPLAGVNLRSANLDDQTAPIGRDAAGKAMLFVRGKGRHTLQLQFHAPVAIAAAQQSLQVQLPSAGSTSLSLLVPGNVEVKSGMSVLRREYNAEKNETRFQLVPVGGKFSLAMSLNNRRLRQDRVVVARSVMISELTTSYERLHATMNMDVLHGAARQFLFDVPAGFQVTNVTSPLLSQWNIRQEEGGSVLEVTLREATRAAEALSITATRAPVVIGKWTMPQLKPRDVAGHVAVVGLLAESRLRPLELHGTDLIHIDTSVLREALPSSVLQADPGAPEIRPIVAYYAPSASFALTASLEDPADEMRVAAHLLLSLNEQRQLLRGGFTLSPQARKRTKFAFRLPAEWRLTRVTASDQKVLSYAQYKTGDSRRYVVTLAKTIEPGKSQTIYFEASYASSQWLGDWPSMDVEFPQVQVEKATDVKGAIAVQGTGDLLAKPLETAGLTPLDSSERSRFGLSESSTELTYEFRGASYRGRFHVDRVQPRLSARNYSFFQVRDGLLAAHYELVYVIDRAHAKQLRLELPDSTPTALAIRGLDKVQLKEYSHEARDGKHIWKVLLAKAEQGTVRLAVDFEQRWADSEPKAFSLPTVRAVDVAYQTHMVAVEGDPALDIAIESSMRPVDIGELAEADYSPGRRLLGAFATTGDTATLQIDVTRRALRPLPAAIVKRAELVTLISSTGVSQSSARYLLQTKIPFLAIRFPNKTELWSVTLNGKPVKPRRRGNQVLLSLQADESNQMRDLQIVYQTPVAPIRWIGRIDTLAPQLWLALDEQDAGAPVPQVDLVWHIHLPSGYHVSRVHGTVFSDDVQRPESPMKALTQATVIVGGGVYGPQRAMMAANRATRQLALARHDRAPAATAPQESDDAYFGDLAGATMEEDAEAPQAGEPASDESMPADKSVDRFSAGDERLKADSKPAEAKVPALSTGSINGPAATPAPPAQPPAAGGSGSGGYPGGFGEGQGGMGGGGGLGMAGMQRGAGRPLGEAATRAPVTQPGTTTAAGQQASGAKGAAPAEPPASGKLGKYWALQGLRGLSIRIDQSEEGITFRSLGADPRLDVTVFQQDRMTWFAWGAALAVLVLGLLLTRAPLRSRVRLVVSLAVLSAGLPVVGGPLTEFGVVFQKTLLATLALILLWVAIAFVVWFGRWTGKILGKVLVFGTPVSVIFVIASLSASGQATAQDLNAILKPLIEESKPVLIPENAVVIPYDPANPEGRAESNKVLVPYKKYVELWNLAHPDKPIDVSVQKHPFSLAGASYELTLNDAENLMLKGTVDLQLFTDQPVDVPLTLAQGVITSALLDGKPARLKVFQPSPPKPVKGQSKNAAAAQPGTAAVLGLLVSGEGRHRLELSVRVAVTRQGGWRLANAVLPHAAATQVLVTVPQQGTHVRRPIGGTTYNETTKAGSQTIPAVLDKDGRFDIAWRAQVTPGAVDQALTAQSTAMVDVREDGLRVVWQVDFAFGQTERASFLVDVPKDYLVEKVDGKNVRGWDLEQSPGRNRLSIELLKAVKQHEQVIILLSQRTSFSATEETSIEIPFVAIPDAALHRGVFQIRRSPILELKTAGTKGVARTEGGTVAKQLQAALSQIQNPLGVQEFQAYEFTATPFTTGIVVSQIAPSTTADLRTLVRIGETESALESEIRISARNRSIYLVHAEIPKDLLLEQVAAPGLSDWSIDTIADRRVLTAFFSVGKTGTVPLSIHGKLSSHTVPATVALPQLKVLDVGQQHGTLVIQVDPSLAAKAIDLVDCRPVLLERVIGWLSGEQRPMARLALEYRGSTYDGKVQITPRTPRIRCDTITNVRMTLREIQETVLLDYEISEAGIRQIKFQLPAWMNDAQVSAPMIREKSIEPVAGQNRVQITLELQDAITGQYRVVVENDRAITGGRQLAPLPLVDGAIVTARYVTLENAGRDEVVVDGTPQMEQLNRQSRQWQRLASRLRGGDFTTAYVTTTNGNEAEFGYRTKQREMVKTAGARIGLARTDLVLDGSGAYRAALLLKVDNRTEPYLEIELPEKASIWTAHVAGRPVKPARAVGSQNDRLLRIPLIKTAEGDLDYAVVIKYAGTLDQFQTLRAVRFPILRTVNINVELSQVKLYLPKTHRWFQFDGTATRVDGEDDFVAGYVAYRTQQVEQLSQIIRGANEFSKWRAASNVQVLEKELKGLQQQAQSRSFNAKLAQDLYSNAQILEEAAGEVAQLEDEESTVTDNRERLNTFYEQQRNTFSKNSVTRLGDNFRQQKAATKTAASAKRSSGQFDQRWFYKSRARGEIAGKDVKKEAAKPRSAAFSPDASRLAGELSQRANQLADMPAAQDAAQKVFQAQQGQAEKAGARETTRRGQGRALGTRDELNRAYVDKIRKQAALEGREAEGGQQFGLGQRGSDQVASGLAADGAVRMLAEQRPAVAAREVGRVGLASLDFTLPERGEPVYFTTPRGEVEITARPVEEEIVERGIHFGWLLAIIVALMILLAVVRRLSQSRRGLIFAAVALMLIGTMMLLAATLPLFALAMILGGVLVIVELRRRPRMNTG